ncbi:hypothetical protein QJQ45_009393 [Haematococcus lacustris]|nr:hypothetical protein QJQ45_009393 [Haematococcus lacustris]
MAFEIHRSGVEKLTERTYAEWSLQMQSVLTVQDLWEVVEDGLDEDEDSQSDKKTKTLERKDAKAKALIQLHLSPQFYQLARESNSGAQLWQKLAELFQRSAYANRLSYVLQIAELRMSAGESVMQYVARAEGLAAKVELTGAPFPDVVAFVLRGLPAEYKSVVEQVKFLEKPSVQKALPHLLWCEAELSKQAEFGMGGSMYGLHVRDGKAVGARQGSSGSSSAAAEVVECWVCHERGHIARWCPHLKEKKEKEKSVEVTQSRAYSSIAW